MKRSFLAIALLACASIASAFYYALAAPIKFTYRIATSFALDAIKLVAGEVVGYANPEVMRVQAKAFVQRIEKRERPLVTSSWRMCPSI